MSTRTPWLRRHQRRMMSLLGVLLAVPAIAAVVWFFMTWDARAFMLMILMALANVVNIINPVAMRRVSRLVREHRGRVCGRCLFVLEGLDDAHRCPECGEAYAVAETIEAWAHDLHMTSQPEVAGWLARDDAERERDQ